MEIKVKFVGGPMHGQEAFTDGLDEFKIFFPPREETVLAYRRIDELVYVYDAPVSKQLTEKYVETRAKITAGGVSSLRFTGDEAVQD